MQLEPERLVKILEVLQELPVPNYRCVRLHLLHSRDVPSPYLWPKPCLSFPTFKSQPKPCSEYILDDLFLPSFLQDAGVPYAPLGPHGLI